MLEPEQFTFVGKESGTARYRREVATPMPEDGNSGYTTEENNMWAYRAGKHWFKVAKVSDRGWTVFHYEESSDGGGLDIVESLGSKQNAQEAQRLALREIHT